MKSSRFYQTWVQIVGSTMDAVLFMSGFFLGKELLIIAIILLAIRIGGKITISELMYKRMQAVVKEGGKSTNKEG